MRGAVVLAGGTSKRLGGNKALIRLGDRPLLLHVVERVSELVSETVVVIGARDDADRYASVLPSTVMVLKDVVEGKGPLAGVLTGMQGTRSNHVLVLPCDSPFVKREVLRYLFESVEGSDAAVPRWPNGNIEPLHAVYRASSAAPAARDALGRGELFIRDMIRRLERVVYVDTETIRGLDPGLTTFFNINSQEDLQAARRLIEK